METAWRQSGRHAESLICLRVTLEEAAHPAIARFRTAGDVRGFKCPLVLPFSVSNDQPVIIAHYYLCDNLISVPDDSRPSGDLYGPTLRISS